MTAGSATEADGEVGVPGRRHPGEGALGDAGDGERGDPGGVVSNRPRGGVSALMSRKRSRSSQPRGCGVFAGGSGGARSWSGGTTGGTGGR